MCDYSLEHNRTRPARKGEQYTTHRFAGGTVGLVSGDKATVICVAYDTKLRLENIPQTVQDAFGVRASESITFCRMENSLFHDGVRFKNGTEITLQRLGTGVKAAVIDDLVEPVRAKKHEMAGKI